RCPGHRDAAAMLADETERLAGEQNQPMWHGAARLELALVRALRGDYPPAKEELWPRLAGQGNRDVRLFRAMAIYALSVAALGVGRYAEAYEYLRRIVDPADDFFHYGACQWVVGDLAEAAVGATRELRTSGGVGRRPGSQGLAQLTPQERQIAQLAAQGLSNRQIGTQLFLSHRTVGSHLYHLFPKLGITTRSQLADFLVAAAGPDGGATS